MDKSLFANGSIIKPPLEENDSIEITRIIIDSRQRNKKLYPNPGQYVIHLEKTISNIISAELSYIDAYVDALTINKNFNSLHFDYGGSKYTVILDEGNYTESELITEINTKISATAIGGGIVASIDPKTKKVILTCGAATTLLNENKENSISGLIGFYDDVDYTLSGPGTLTSPLQVNLLYNYYAALHINDFHLIESVDPGLDGAFAVTPYNTDNKSSIPLYQSLIYKKYFTPRIHKLTKLNIEWKDKSEGIYQFNSDHRFEIVFTRYKQKYEYRHVVAN